MRKIRGRPGAELIGATGQAQLHLLYLAVPLITGCRQQHCADSGAGWLMSLILYSTGTGVVYIGHSAVVGMRWPVDREYRLVPVRIVLAIVCPGAILEEAAALKLAASSFICCMHFEPAHHAYAILACQPAQAYAHTFSCTHKPYLVLVVLLVAL